MKQTSSKESIARLVKICERKGLQNVVISPGSRNAPLTLSFAENDAFHCLNIPDERSAAFFALGMALQSNKPVILCCTSGSAALNYAPAIAEAYYQKIPLLILTADRPLEWIDQRAGQTMRQRNVYHNYIKKSFELIEEADQEEHIWYNDRIVNEAINETTQGKYGPVHINVPLREPLYDLVSNEKVGVPKIIEHLSVQSSLSNAEMKNLLDEWHDHSKVLVIVGQGQGNDALNNRLDQFGQLEGVVILTESTSNVLADNVFPSIDRLIDSISVDEYESFTPDLIISIGSAIVSKKIRFMLRAMKVASHWQVDEHDTYVDTYQSLTRIIPIPACDLLDGLLHDSKSWDGDRDYQMSWTNREQQTLEAHGDFVKNCPWSDLLVFHHIFEAIPSGAIHLASSTPVRYTQLFPRRDNLQYYCNRGVSGIDGCSSTAAGFAYMTNEIVTLVTGDLAFFYDSNAYWHNQVNPNLKTILINNQGGNIFRYVKGPDQTNHLDQHFEAKHETSAAGIAKAYGMTYQSASDVNTLLKGLNWLYEQHDLPALLEIHTPGEVNIDILKEYFTHLQQSVG